MVLQITPQELKSYIDQNKKLAILDVREHEELLISALPSADNIKFAHIPLMQLPDQLELWKQCSDAVDYRIVICRVGGRSANAVEFLNSELGLQHYNLVGGINAYAKEVDSSVVIY